MSSVIGVGIDLLSISRLERVLPSVDRMRQLSRHILSSVERMEFESLLGEGHHHRKYLYYLGNRFSVKEAAYKSVSHILKLEWKDLRLHYNLGIPQLTVCRESVLNAAKAHGFSGFSISITHEEDFISTISIARSQYYNK